ncbi:hypothetical protein ACQKKE_03440 [Desemzia incerta]|uniref:hypothetical protein n=1 Tax=Desemzia incerta TaxID=82801 RepID=UPI003D04623E
MNERGAILPSIMVFVFLLVVVLLGSVQIYRNQMYQLLATTEMYEAKSMLSFTEREILDRSKELKMLQTGTITFNNGKVYINKTDSMHYQLEAVTTNQFSLVKQIAVPTIKNGTVQDENEKGIAVP